MIVQHFWVAWSRHDARRRIVQVRLICDSQRAGGAVSQVIGHSGQETKGLVQINIP